MDIRQAFGMALKSLLARKLRSVLTMLGIIIGVAAVIAIMTIGRGTVAKVEAQFDNMGANMISVSIYGRNAARQIGVEDMYELVGERQELLRDLSPVVPLGGGVKYGSASHGKTAVYGVSEAYPESQVLHLLEGEFFQYMDVERRARVCVVGSFVAEEIMGGSALGGRLKIKGQNYTVVGVLAAADELEVGEGGADDVVYVPYTNVLQLGQTPLVSSYYLNSASREVSEAAVAAVEEYLQGYYGEEDFRVTSQKARMELMLAVQGSMLSVLSAIAGIALLVGGVGIMNIMSVAVAERTKEIGVRKSFGARRGDIRLQFIVEAACTSMAGGVLGVAAGIGASLLACRVMELPFRLAFDALLLALGVSVGLGLAFGLLPAERAARMEPIEALRHE